MVAASVIDVQPHADRLKNTKDALRQAIDSAAADEQLVVMTGAMVQAMSKLDEKLKVARNTIPKVAKSRAKPKASPS